ncbi:MAG TPA: thioredoxin domain-containing protein [Vicinamibacterales bacterium]
MKTVLTALTVVICCTRPTSLLAQSSGPPNESKPVAIVGGQPVSDQELQDAIGSQQLMQLRNQQYEIESKTLENLIRLKLVQAEATKRGMTPEALVAQEVDSKVADPSDSEVEAFFWGQNRADVRFENVKEQFRSALKTLKVQKARSVYADSLRKTINVRVMLRPPSVDVSYDPSRVRGDANAPVTIVEFSDFQCPFCKQAEAALQAVMTKYGSKVKLAFMDFPLREIHPRAQAAAEAARCANEQGKFWEYHDVLYADQTKLDTPGLIASARGLGMNDKAFQSCLDSGKFKEKIDADLALGQSVGVAGTPGFFINGVFLSGSQPQAEFEKIIDTQLALSEK